MRIFRPLPAQNAELAHPLDSEHFETINVLANGVTRGSSWRPLEFALITEDEGRRLDQVDMPWLGSSALVLKQRAVDALLPILVAHGELLPLTSRPKLWIFNATHVVDALDEPASDVTRFSSGRIMFVGRYVFKPAPICTLAAFRIPNLRVSPIFLSQAFVDRCVAAQLTGVEFEQVWAGDDPAA